MQGVDHALPAAQELLRNFAFIPYARLDDVMVSYAPPGGGVGPHFDSYDVFLLQGTGAWRWQISRQRDLSLIGDAMVRKVKRMLGQIRWDGAEVERFLGCYLSEPKPHVAFARPARLLTRLTDRRRLPPGMKIGRESAQWLYQWYRAGYIELNQT